jgi:hypothetical protein
MSTKNVVDAYFVTPVSAARFLFGDVVDTVSVTAHWAAGAINASLASGLARIFSPFFTEYEVSAALIPVPARDVYGRNKSWR